MRFLILLLISLVYGSLTEEKDKDFESWRILEKFKSMTVNSPSRASMESTGSEVSSHHIWEDEEELLTGKKFLNLGQDSIHGIMKHLDLQDHMNLMMTSKSLHDHILSFAPGFNLHGEMRARCRLTRSQMRNFYNDEDTEWTRIDVDDLSDECLETISRFCKSHEKGHLRLRHPIRVGSVSEIGILNLKKMSECPVDVFVQAYQRGRRYATSSLRQLTMVDIISFTMHTHAGITSENVKDISALFTRPGNQLREIDIGSNVFESYEAFEEFLQQLTHPNSIVEILELRRIMVQSETDPRNEGVELGNRGAQIIGKFLSTPRNNITSLNLVHSGIDGDGIVDLGQSFLSKNNVVKQLDLHANYLTRGNNVTGFTKFCRFLRRNTNLLSLGMSHVGLDENSIQLLTDIVLNSPLNKIEKLNVKFNRISTRSLKMISDSLKQNYTSLKHLYISDKIDNEGCSFIADALKSRNSKLVTLDMQGCGLTAHCASVLAKALSSPYTKLEGLNLYMNQIFSSGILGFLNLAKQPTSRLKYLNLSENSVVWYSQLFQEILNVLKFNNGSLRSLNVAQSLSSIRTRWKQELLAVAKKANVTLRLSTP